MKESTFSSRIKELRTSLGLTQVEFAEKIGTTQATLSSYENTDKTPSLEIVKNIADTFSISIDWLLGRSEKQSLSLELSTYTDLIKIIIQFINTQKIIINTSLTTKSSKTLPFPFDTLNINIDDKHIVDFYNEWKDISAIRHKTPTGEKLYDIWLKDVYERFNIPLERSSSDFDEKVPFN